MSAFTGGRVKTHQLMSRRSNIIPFRTAGKYKRLRWFGLILGLLAIGSFGAIAGYHWHQSELTALSTVKAFTPRVRGYAETTVSARGPGGYRVIDGDTIEAPFGVKYRLLGFDTPETYFSKCDEELELGRRATERLEELMASGVVLSGICSLYSLDQFTNDSQR